MKKLQNRTRRNKIKIAVSAVVLLLITPGLFVFLTAQNIQTGGSPLLKGLKTKPLEFNYPEIKKSSIATTGQLYTINDPDTPLVNLQINFVDGHNSEGRKEAGRLRTLLRLIKLGGAGKRSGQEIADELALLGADISFSASHEQWSVNLRALKSDFLPALAILKDLLLLPELSPELLGVIKGELTNEIIKRNDRPQSIARRRLHEIIHAGDSRGYYFTKEDIEKITLADIKHEYRYRLNRRDIEVALSGDLSGADLSAQVKKMIQELPDSGEKREKYTTTHNYKRYLNKIVLVKQPAAQAVIAAGRLLPPHNHSDFYALQTANYILGGSSFNSRLMREIRARRGLAYYVYSYNGFFRDDGYFSVLCGTGTATTFPTLKLMLETIGALRQGVSSRELDLAHESIPNSLIYGLELTEAYLDNHLRFIRHRMPENYLNQFPQKIRSVNRSEIIRAAAYYNPEDLIVVVVGPEELKEELSRLRPVEVVTPDQKLF